MEFIRSEGASFNTCTIRLTIYLLTSSLLNMIAKKSSPSLSFATSREQTHPSWRAVTIVYEVILAQKFECLFHWQSVLFVDLGAC